ncbi:hypothetical protein ANO14919_088370 [Xylariales sp. No.14919]|nr:hypothetical protein ANO14919_088370 [Xylariales sp. No.14919]
MIYRKGLVFFGTPHGDDGTGSATVEHGLFAAKIAESLGYSSDDGAVLARVSESLFSQFRDSSRYLLQNYYIVSFWEKKNTIVTEESATFGLPRHREMILGLEADHSNICKFNTDEEHDRDMYKSLVEPNFIWLYDEVVKGNAAEGRLEATTDQNMGSQLSGPSRSAFRGFGFGKRKSTAGIPSSDNPTAGASSFIQSTSMPKPEVAIDEGSTGKLSRSTSFSGSMSEISLEYRFNAGDADMDVGASDPEHETDTKDSPRVERFADPEAWLARLQKMRNEVMTASFLNQTISTRSMHRTDMAAIKQADVGEIMSLESTRPTVARLIHVAVADIRSLADSLRAAFDREDFRAVINVCSKFLERLVFAIDRPSVFYIDTEEPIELARFTALLLDLAILSYSGVHVERLHPDVPTDEYSWFSPILMFSLRRRQLRCLGACLKSPVWVFEMPNAIEEGREAALYLSTSIADLANIWGPVWAVKNEEGAVVRYDVGLGSIVGSERYSDEPEVLEGEVFCHWISASDQPPPQLHMNSELAGDRMLIGGRLTSNHSCTLDCSTFTYSMRNKNRARPWPVGWQQWYTDGRTVNASLGGLGITVGGSETYKLRSRSYRNELEDALSHDDFDCCLAAIQHRSAVEISACTGLSRRRSLKYALGFPGMENYLCTSDLDWEKDEWREAYFRLIRQGDMPELRRCINEKGFGSIMRRALKKSMLNVILKAGLDTSQNLVVFWQPSRGEGPHSVLYNFGDYNWIRLLKDGPLGFNTAILDNICLEFISESGEWKVPLTCTRGGRNPNYISLLETYLLVNDELRRRNEVPRGLSLTDYGREGYRNRWDIQGVQAGEIFDLGEHGSLKVIRVFGLQGSGFIMRWRDLSPSRARELLVFTRQAIGMTPERLCHREYLIQRDGAQTAPILIHVVS